MEEEETQTSKVKKSKNKPSRKDVSAARSTIPTTGSPALNLVEATRSDSSRSVFLIVRSLWFL